MNNEESSFQYHGNRHPLSDLLYFYGIVYGPQIVLVVTLSAITLYRREISCNRVYAEEEEENDLNPVAEQSTLAPTITVVEEEEEEEEVGYLSLSNLTNFFHANSKFAATNDEKNTATTPSSMVLLPVNTGTSKTLLMKRDISVGDLLDLAGNYYCAEAALSFMLLRKLDWNSNLFLHDKIPRQHHHNNNDTSIITTTTKDDWMGLDMDSWIHIMTFLHPRDICSMGSCNRGWYKLVHSGDYKEPTFNSNTHRLWKSIWKRDYSWIFHHWTVGKRALKRSCGPSEPGYFDKLVFFRFALSWMDFVLAGYNGDMASPCLVGIGGHVYDLTNFLLEHPGSPETLIAHAGQDATKIFALIGHSKGARKLAQAMCVVVDLSYANSSSNNNPFGLCGLRPTSRTKLIQHRNHPDDVTRDMDVPRPVQPPDENLMMRTCAKQPTNLKRQFELERKHYQIQALQYTAGVLTQPKVFFDPMQQVWKAWYVDSNLTNVFIENLQS